MSYLEVLYFILLNNAQKIIFYNIILNEISTCNWLLLLFTIISNRKLLKLLAQLI